MVKGLVRGMEQVPEPLFDHGQCGQILDAALGIGDEDLRFEALRLISGQVKHLNEAQCTRLTDGILALQNTRHKYLAVRDLANAAEPDRFPEAQGDRLADAAMAMTGFDRAQTIQALGKHLVMSQQKREDLAAAALLIADDGERSIAIKGLLQSLHLFSRASRDDLIEGAFNFVQPLQQSIVIPNGLTEGALKLNQPTRGNLVNRTFQSWAGLHLQHGVVVSELFKLAEDLTKPQFDQLVNAVIDQPDSVDKPQHIKVLMQTVADRLSEEQLRALSASALALSGHRQQKGIAAMAAGLAKMEGHSVSEEVITTLCRQLADAATSFQAQDDLQSDCQGSAIAALVEVAPKLDATHLEGFIGVVPRLQDAGKAAAIVGLSEAPLTRQQFATLAIQAEGISNQRLKLDALAALAANTIDREA